jgi:hypothetical protein
MSIRVNVVYVEITHALRKLSEIRHDVSGQHLIPIE